MPASVLLLKSLPIFRGLPTEFLDLVGQAMALREFARREIILKKDEPPTGLHFLFEGRLQGLDFTIDGREVGLYFVEPGQYFGELAAIDEKLHPEFVIAISKALVGSLPMSFTRSLFRESHEVATDVLWKLAARLRHTAQQRVLLSMPNPAQRVCALLVSMLSSNVAREAVIHHVPTHQELAIMVNSSRETVTRVFQVLQSRGVVRRHDSDLLVLQPERLAAIAKDGIDSD